MRELEGRGMREEPPKRDEVTEILTNNVILYSERNRNTSTGTMHGTLETH